MNTWLHRHAEAECCHLATTGRRSGRMHEIEIWFGVLDDTLYLISGNGATADWYRNLIVTPEVSVRIGEETHHGIARPVDVVPDAQERQRVGDLMRAKYVWDGDPSIGLTYDAWCYEVPAAAIEFG